MSRLFGSSSNFLLILYVLQSKKIEQKLEQKGDNTISSSLLFCVTEMYFIRNNIQWI